jgi:hypothetical protein
MDELAQACAEAAADKMDEAMDIQKALDNELVKEDEKYELPEIYFDEDGMSAHINGKFIQIKCCCSKHLCNMKEIPINVHLRCDSCGFCCHRSCQVKLNPPIDGLRFNQICEACAQKFGLHVTNRKEVLSLDNDFLNLVSLNLRDMPVEIVSQKTLDDLKHAHKDGLDDDIESIH